VKAGLPANQQALLEGSASMTDIEGHEGFFSIPRLTAWSFQGVTDGCSPQKIKHEVTDGF